MISKLPENEETISAVEVVRDRLQDTVICGSWDLLFEELVNLEYEDLREVLEMKAKSESLGLDTDTTQSEVAECVAMWVRRDLKVRQGHLKELRRWFCLHRLKGPVRQAIMDLIHKECRDSRQVNDTNMGDMFRTSVDKVSGIYNLSLCENKPIGMQTSPKCKATLRILHAQNPKYAQKNYSKSN